MKRTLWIIFGCSILTAANSASFDCLKAQSKIEKLICNSKQLSEQDENLTKLYKSALDRSNSDEKQRLVSEQTQWLKGIRNICGDELCLVKAYSSRIDRR